jgi:TfoX/Sxy family transcriptional regulator of competence genes
MASDASFVEHVRDQAGLGTALTSRKMFGEYALYLDGKVLAFICDNQLFVKMTDQGRQLLGAAAKEGFPYPKAKPHLAIGSELDDRELLKRLLLVTADALPMPQPKAPKRARKS